MMNEGGGGVVRMRWWWQWGVCLKTQGKEGVGTDNMKPSLHGSVSGCRWVAGGGVGFCGSFRTSIPQVPEDGECRVRWYGGMECFCAYLVIWDPPLTFSAQPSLLSYIPTPTPFLKQIGGCHLFMFYSVQSK